MKHPLLSLLLVVLSWNALQAQVTFPYNGVQDHREGLYAFTNATIHTRYDETLENATLVIRRGKVEAVGVGIPVPAGAVVLDCAGKSIYPSFLDPFTDYGMPEPKAEGRRPQQQPQMLSNKKGAFAWNEALKSEFRAHEHFTRDDKKAQEWLKLGFGAVLSHRPDGISRGSAALVLLGDQREHELIVEEKAAHVLSFSKGTSTQNYPSSLMGSIALLRQTYLDGAWYERHGRDEEVNLSLEAWNELQSLPQIFAVNDMLDALRAARIGEEFGVRYIIKGSGDEYQRLRELEATGSPFILPLNFPDAYDVEDPLDARLVSLQQMKHWELAPTNPARLAAEDVTFAFTTDGLKKKSDFLKNLRKALRYGLSKEQALQALTLTPARLLGVDDRLGSLEPGKIANFIITDGDVFEEKTTLYHNWVRGKPTVFKPLEEPSLKGTWKLSVGDSTYTLKATEKDGKTTLTLQLTDTTTAKVKHSLEAPRLTLSFQLPGQEGKVRLSGIVRPEQWKGRGQLADGTWVQWSASPEETTDTPEEKERSPRRKKEGAGPDSLGEVWYPFLPYGWTEPPQPQTYLLTNATVWTNEAEGVLENADVLIRDGKIAAVGKNLARQGTVIDCTGKHITPGIIDEHSHIAISRGVNEGSQASSAEVRIGDVVNSEDINIYRQLSGGVTAAQLLHGSANPIGGQSALIKMRWGAPPEEMKIRDADGFIKFALGENVKQSNWGDNNRTRFPQTRMGVEQVFEDMFTRAREYGERKRSGKPYRPDLELEALLEILQGKRFITCHSYRQSEINMLMKLAERHGFRVNTFTHILEGYKVADKMAAHGAGGSTFSDWWAYKFEVYEAIPHNGALMHEQGVTVAFNSDDAEMARRLNQEAAKAVRFGGVSEEEALKFVTLNPAKLLHLDHRMGSLRPGKDADLVVWSDHPLSIYAKAEMTFVDGIKRFDRQEDLQLRERIAQERNRLIQKMLEVKKNGGRTQRPNSTRPRLYHCEDLEP